MLLSAVSVLVVAQSSSEIPEGLKNNPVYNIWYVLCSSVDSPLPANSQSTEKHDTYQLLYIYSTPPDDRLQICPKHVDRV